MLALESISDTSSTEIWELVSDEGGSNTWKDPVALPSEAQLASALESPLDSKTTRVRLFLTTGMNDSARKIYSESCLKVPLLFFEYHKSDKPHTYVSPELVENAFFAKWSRPALQRMEYWTIEHRISQGTP